MDSKKNKKASPGDTSTGNSTSPIAPGSVGAVSQEIGYDVRDLIMMGFTHTEVLFFSREEIMSVVEGKLTLHQLRKEHNPTVQNNANQHFAETADLESDDLNDIPELSNKQVEELVLGLWAAGDLAETSSNSASTSAAKYREQCKTMLRKLGKEAIPFLEPHAHREEAASLIEEIKKSHAGEQS